MSDSGWSWGGCDHGNDPWRCYLCLQEEVNKLRKEVSDRDELLARFAQDSEAFKFGAEVERSACASIASGYNDVYNIGYCISKDILARG